MSVRRLIGPVINNTKQLIHSLNGTATMATTKKAAAAAAAEPTITKSELVKLAAKEADVTQDESKKIIDAFMKGITDNLVDGKTVNLSAFGSFSTYKSKATTGRNPATGESITVPAKTRIRFKGYQGLKDALN